MALTRLKDGLESVDFDQTRLETYRAQRVSKYLGLQAVRALYRQPGRVEKQKIHDAPAKTDGPVFHRK